MLKNAPRAQIKGLGFSVQSRACKDILLLKTIQSEKQNNSFWGLIYYINIRTVFSGSFIEISSGRKKLQAQQLKRKAQLPMQIHRATDNLNLLSKQIKRNVVDSRLQIKNTVVPSFYLLLTKNSMHTWAYLSGLSIYLYSLFGKFVFERSRLNRKKNAKW